MKVLGRVIDGVGEVSVLKKKIKREGDPHNKSVLEVRLKMARKKERKAIAALVLSSIFMASVSQLFRFLSIEYIRLYPGVLEALAFLRKR